MLVCSSIPLVFFYNMMHLLRYHFVIALTFTCSQFLRLKSCLLLPSPTLFRLLDKMFGGAWEPFEGGRKKRKGGGPAGDVGKSSENHNELMEYSAHMIMKMASDIRALKATVFVVVLFDSETATAVTIKDTMKDYRSKTEGNPGHGYGPSDSFVWRGVVQTMLADTNLPQAIRALFDQHAKDGTPDAIKRLVGHARMNSTYKKDSAAMSRLELGGRPQVLPVFDAATDWLVKNGDIACSGKAPRSHNERQLSRVMEDLKMWAPTGGRRGAPSAAVADDEDFD